MQNPNHIPSWAEQAVFYQVYPQSFYDSNGDGIGDLEGVRLKLDYIRSTGATAIWISPFFLSPMRDAGYDVQDYVAVDPRYGDLSDAVRLFEEAHRKGLKVLIDFVPGHTSIDHPWFKASAQEHPPQPYKNWYIWTDSAWDDGGEPWNQKMIHGYSNRNGNYLINFFWSQPALNYGFAQPEPDKPWQLPCSHPDVQALWKEMRRVLRFWLEKGVDGFRVDMADSLIRNDPDHVEIRRFWREVREELDPDFPELFLIAEGHPSHLLDGTGFHAAFLHWTEGYQGVFRAGETVNQELGRMKSEAFFSRSGRGDFRPYLSTWRMESEKTRGGGMITMPVGNHDLSRVAVGQTDDDLELIAAFQMCWPGIPFIYYGDEIGMRQQSSDNPVFEGHYPTRNGARTPMQWDSSRNCGFSDCDPESCYLPVDPDPRGCTVAGQEADPRSLLNRVRALIRLRCDTPALHAQADIRILSDGAPGEHLAFLRCHGSESALCIFHPSDRPCALTLPDPLPESPRKQLAGGVARIDVSSNQISLPGCSWGIWRL
jgi:maltose alpha-D-glucosyltransferase/alpha-amylase